MSRLRGFQQDVKQASNQAFADGAQVVMPVIPCGGGKTVLMGNMAGEHDGYGCAIAHRSPLVMQISVALAKEGVRHDIVAPDTIVRQIVSAHMEDVGRSYYDGRANWKVASIDTILRRQLDQRWLNQVTLTFQDEGHHVLRDNKWGRGQAMFPNARGVFPTATPCRADGKGLGRSAEGMVDVMVEGPDMRWMVENGYLTKYHVIAPKPSDFDMDGVDISPVTGDYNNDQMRKRVKASAKIVGDVVKTYLEWARGKLGITFAVDVEHATTIAAAYNAAGVPAVVVTSDTPENDRRRYMQRFVKRELLQLVNVDLFGEGVDVPALEVVSMARPTASYSLFVQQFGRPMRLAISPILAAAWDTYTVPQRLAFIASSEKSEALIIDHVGNVITHGGPPDYRNWEWSLESRSKRTRATDVIPMRACTNPVCLRPYERFYPECPHCGMAPPVPVDRSKPEHVDGDVVLYTDEMLKQLFGERDRIDGPCYFPSNVAGYVANVIAANHTSRQQAQAKLRDMMRIVLPPSVNPRVNDRKFYLTYGVDTLTAQTLGSTEAEQLRQRIIEKVTQHEVP